MQVMSEKPRKENVDFRFRPELAKDEKSTMPIEILVEKYKGVVYSYGQVKFEGDDEQPILNFNYWLLEGSVDQNDAEFKTLLGDIIISMIQESIEHNDRKDDSKKPDSK